MARRGQVWIETVIYTLIGLAIIGILLGIVKPAIDEKKDRILIEQSEIMLDNIDSQIEEVRYYGAGNTRPIDIKISKGELSIDSVNDIIEFSAESRYMYSELGKEISVGRIKARTIEKGKKYEVHLKLDYSALNLTWNSEDIKKIFKPAPTAYKIYIQNKGKVNELINIDFS